MIESTWLALIVGGLIGGVVVGIYALIWKLRYTRTIRRDSVSRSRATISGQVHEQLLPVLPDFPYNPKDVRFLGSPIDLVIFDGLEDGALRRIVIVEVKTGKSRLNAREVQVREAVQAGRVEWQELRR